MEHKKICLTTPETATALHEIGFFAGHRSNIEEQKYVLLHQVRMEEHMLQTAASLANTME